MRNKSFNLLGKIASYREFVLVVVLVACCLGVSLFTPYFFTKINLLSMLMGLTVEGVISIGMVMVLVCGGIDLSVGSTMAFTGVVVGLLLKSGLPVVPAIALAALAALAIGALNGLLIAKVRLNPFITTLGTMSAVKGLTLIFSRGQAILDMPASFKAIGQGGFGDVQFPIVAMLAFLIGGDLLLRNSRFLRQSYYVGSNENAAKLNGIKVDVIKVFVYCVSALMAGIAGVMITARFGSASVTLGDNTALNVITACIIGGASLSGGEGSVLGAFLGAVFIQLLSTSLNLLNVNIYWQNFVTGLILILAIFIDSMSERRGAARRAV